MRYVMLLLVVFIALLCATLRADESSSLESDPLWIEVHGNGIYTTSDKDAASKKAQKLGDEFNKGGMLALAKKTDRALESIIHTGYLNLRHKGFATEAAWLNNEWQKHVGEVERLVKNPSSRSIGDFEPLSKYLAIAYELLEFKLGYQLCYTLRLSDLKSLNYGIPVVFRPCPYGEAEFELHFIHDMRYRGLFPVVAYWSTVLSCSVATFGIGIFFICSPIAMLVELGVDRAVAPWLAPRLYSLACS